MLAELRARYETDEQLRIEGEVGAGGFGRVYRAHHLRLDTPVAVKVLNAQLHGRPAVLKLFSREARVMARIDHPNVLRVFDYGDGPEGPYIVTEWMSGGAIDRADSDARLRAIASSAASGLQALHEASIVHRDIKPANLFCRDDGRIKLGDLGVALAGEDAADREQFVGTLLYMAPELFEASPRYGSASDVYALGVSLYQLWTGKLPFVAQDLEGLLEVMKRPAQPAQAIRGGMTSTLAGLIAAMMDRSPASRPSTAEVVRELTAAPSVPPTVPPNAPSITALGTPPPAQELVRIGSWVCSQEIYRGNVWNTFFAHHRDTGRQARLGRLLGDWFLPVPAMVEAAKRSSQWSHPSMVAMLDWGTFEDRPYFVSGAIGMRILDLAQIGTLGEVEALQFVEQLADALAFIHERGFVFQMVDPSAIGSRPSGRGYMLDWPAFAMPIGGAISDATRYLSPFCAPEVATARTFAPQPDVYGLGSSFAFVLTGSKSWLGRVSTGAIPDNTQITAASRALLSALTAQDPEARPTAAEARDWAAAIRARLEPIKA